MATIKLKVTCIANMVFIQDSTNNDTDQQKSTYIPLMEVQTGTATLERILETSSKMRTAYDLAIVLLSM